MNMKRTAGFLCVLTAVAAACQSKDNTKIVVEVSSDLDVPSQLDAIRIEVKGPTATSSKSYALSSPSQLPVRLALVPQDADDALMMVRVVGLNGGSEVAWQAAWVAFVPGDSKLLRLTLDWPCAYVNCSPSQSCADGICVPVPTVTSLPDYDPTTNLPATGGVGGEVSGGGDTGGAIIPFGGTVSSGGTSSTRGRTGGTSGTGGSSSIGGMCAEGPACGGDVIGTWEVSSSCLQHNGYADISYLGLTCVPNLARITGSLSVTGSLSFNANGRYTDNTITTGSEVWELDRSCLNLSGTRVMCSSIGSTFSGALASFGYQDFRCVDAASGGCTCQGRINQTGGMGMLYNYISPTGSYKVAGNTLMREDQLSHSYCVSGTKMTMTPIPIEGTPHTGTVVLQKSCSGAVCTGGIGGNPGSGGASGGSVSTGGSKSSGSTSTVVSALPCEIVAQDGGGAKCVAAHSTVRTIVPGYSGPLYLLCKGSTPAGPGTCNGVTLEIFARNGYADGERHEAFCGSETCTIRKIYDQSGQKNDLEPAPKGGAKSTPANPAKASALPVMVNGHKAYGVLIKAGMGYRTGCNGCTIKKTNGMPLNDEPQTVYMVTSQKDLIEGCCFDYGNAETTSNADGNGAAEALYFGGGVVWGSGYGSRPGPWVMADLENGVYAGWENNQDKQISTNKPLPFDYVTAVLVGDTADKNNGKGRFALYGADAQGLDASLGKLTCMYDGIRPEKAGYVPMQKQGSLILGTGTDNSSGGGGRFYEGATIAGPVLSSATLSALHDAIVAAKYQNAE